MGALIRAHDWETTPLGPPDTWPQPLRTMLRLLLNTSRPMYVWWGPQLLCFYNDAYRQFIGIERHPGSLGRPGRDVWEEIWPVIGPQIDHVMSGAGSISHENALVPITRNGRLEDVYWTYSYEPIDEDTAANGVGGVLVICTETTSQVSAARRASEERQRLAELFEQAPTFMAMLRGTDHRIELANPSYRRLVGNRDIVGKTITEALPELTAQGYVELLDAVYRSGKPHSATEAKYAMQSAPEGPVEERYADFVYQPLRDPGGAVSGIFVQGSDVTDRVLARAAHVDSEARFHTLAENLPTLCWMADGTGYIFWYNSRWYEYTGSTPEQMEGWGWQSVHDQKQLPVILERWRASLATGERFEMVFPLRGVDGEFRPFLTRVVPLRDPTGSIIRWFGTNTDISQQLAAEAALRDADRRKDEFLATLAHELRNPLAPVRNAAKVLRAARTDTKTRKWAAKIIDRQIQTMASLLDDLLDVSRITRGNLTLNRQRISLSSIIEASLEVARPIIDARQHTLTVLLPPEAIDLDVDPLRFTQVLANLLTNAAKYMEPRGRIDLTAKIALDGVDIGIKDFGVGIDAESLAVIFNMFSQVKSTLDRSEGGLGIGLALVKGLVELHGGTVHAYSEGLGCGSEFHVLQPLAKISLPTAAKIVDENPQIKCARCRVLVVDDNQDAAQSLGFLLELSGHEVSFAHDGEHALTVAREFRPNVTLLDISLPKLNGYDVAQALRRESWGKKMILIAITGWGHEDDRRRALESGFDFHLTKPVDPDQIEALIATQTAPPTSAH